MEKVRSWHMSQNQIPFYYNFHYIFHYILFSCELGPRILHGIHCQLYTGMFSKVGLGWKLFTSGLVATTACLLTATKLEVKTFNLRPTF